MKVMKRTLALILMICMLLTVLAACGGGSTAPAAEQPAAEKTAAEEEAPAAAPAEEANITEKSGDTTAVAATDGYLRDKVTVAISSDGQTFEPFARASWGSVVFPLFQSLAETDSEGNLRLVLLKSFEQVDDVTYNAEIWDCIYDSEGRNLKASDVEWSIQKFIDEGNKGAVNRLDSIEVTGDYTFVWHCSDPFGLGEMGKNLGNGKILVQETYEAHGESMASSPVGTGPYVLENYTPGSSVTLVANEDFWMKNIDDEAWLAENRYVTSYQNVREIEYQIIQDAGSRAVALEMGTVDAVDSLNAADVDYFIQNPDLGIVPVELPQDPPVAFYFDCNEASPCSDVNLRKAICYAIDNVGIAAGVSFPAQPAYGIHPRMYDAPAEWLTGREYYDYNVETAKEYLEQSSYNGETLTVIYMDQGAITDSVIMLQAALGEIGIKVNLLPADMQVLNEYKLDYTKWDMMFDVLGGGNYLSATLKRFWTEDSAATNNGNQVFGIVDSHLDDLFLDLRDNTSDETIAAWDDYFTFEQCYGYAILVYSNQTACQADINCVLTGAQHNVCPQAFTFTD